MFNWFWEFLYSISAVLFLVVDGLFSIANKLCGIEPIHIDGHDRDFLLYLLTDKKVTVGFVGAVFIGLFLLIIFSIIAICKSCKNEKQTPTQIAVNVFKTIGLFLVVPAIMISFTLIVNQIIIALYNATSIDSPSMGEFLCRSFMPDDIQQLEGSIDFSDAGSVKSFMKQYGYSLKKYKFFFSWLVCFPVVTILAMAILNFVDRTLSIIILYIASPIVLSTAIADDGAHFKLWRDEIFIKYLTGFGIVIALNVYVLVISAICSGDFRFFDNSFLNFLFRMAFVLGGAIFVKKMPALIGNLIGRGVGDSEMATTKGYYDHFFGDKGGGSKNKKEKESKEKNKNKDSDNSSNSDSKDSPQIEGGDSTNNNVINTSQLGGESDTSVKDAIEGVIEDKDVDAATPNPQASTPTQYEDGYAMDDSHSINGPSGDNDLADSTKDAIDGAGEGAAEAGESAANAAAEAGSAAADAASEAGSAAANAVGDIVS